MKIVLFLLFGLLFIYLYKCNIKEKFDSIEPKCLNLEKISKINNYILTNTCDYSSDIAKTDINQRMLCRNAEDRKTILDIGNQTYCSN